VLVLVGEQELVDEPTLQERIPAVQVNLAEHLEGALAHLLEVRKHLAAVQNRQLPANLAGLLDRVVETAELSAKRFPAADPANEPELLEVGDVPEVPDERAEDRRVDAVQLLVVEWLYQLKRAPARLCQALGDLLLDCPGSRLRDDGESLKGWR
jgi:hypothetical protein